MLTLFYEPLQIQTEWIQIVGSVRDLVWASVDDSDSGSVKDLVWYSIYASVGDSVCASVCASVDDSVRDSVGDLVWDSDSGSVWDSVWDSVRAYTSSFFKIQYEYDFSSAVKLWNAGFVPSFDGKKWRLHSGKTAEVVYERRRK